MMPRRPCRLIFPVVLAFGLTGCGGTRAQPPLVTVPPQAPTAAVASAPASFLAYAFGTLNSTSGGVSAITFPAGNVVGTIAVGGTTQGEALALAPDGQRAYLLDREGVDWRLSELVTPSLQVLHRTLLPDAINLLGTGRVVTVAPDGRHVYVETMRIVGPERWDAQLRVGQPESVYGIAVYDVAQGAFTGQIPLAAPWCGVADLFALPDGRLSLFCPTAGEVRLVDPGQGKQIASVAVGMAAGSVPSPDGRHFWLVRDTGEFVDVALTSMTITGRRQLGDDTGRWVPLQRLALAQAGQRLYLRAAPGDAEFRARGLGTVVWVVDTATRQRVAVVPLPAPAIDLVPAPDGRTLLTTTANTGNPQEEGTRLVDATSGRELRRWPGRLDGYIIR